MKIAFISTRGIPNNYGGFEQFAEYISVGLVRRGMKLWYTLRISILTGSLITRGYA